MNLFQALSYFLAESIVNLRRGWRTSLFAVLTIATSLFVGGVFLFVGGNAGRLVETWRGDARVILYLDELASSEEREALRAAIAARPEVRSVELVTGEEATARFESYFPRVAASVGDAQGLDLPASLEVALDSGEPEERALWIEELSTDVRIAGVDDDVEWLARLDRGLAIGRWVTFALWLVLIAGTVVTIASLVRLSTFTYREEIEILRLVGSTEFLIRGPFYVEGMLQGLLGGACALVGLWGGYGLLQNATGSAVVGSLLADFLSSWACAALLGLGAGAGFVGALLAVPREHTG